MTLKCHFAGERSKMPQGICDFMMMPLRCQGDASLEAAVFERSNRSDRQTHNSGQKEDSYRCCPSFYFLF